MDCSLPGSSVHGIFQAIVLEWIAISFSRGPSQPRDRTQVSCIVDRRFTVWATREVLGKSWQVLLLHDVFPSCRKGALLTAKIINKMIKKKKRARSRANINALPKPNTDLSAEGRTLASSADQSTTSDQILPAQWAFLTQGQLLQSPA